MRTIGGGLIVEAVEGRVKAKRPEVLADLQERAAAILDPRRFVEYCVRRGESSAVAEPAIAVRTKIPRGRVREILADWPHEQIIFSLPAKGYVHRDTAAEIAQRILEVVADFHRQSPESPGLALEQLKQFFEQQRGQSHFRRDENWDSPHVRRSCGGRWRGGASNSEGRLVERNLRLALPEHRSSFGDEDAKLSDSIEALFRDQPFSPPDAKEVARHVGVAADKVEKMLSLLREHERLIQAEGGMLFHRDAVDRAREILVAHFRKEGRLESVQFKYLLDTTRKYALPLLDYLDRTGVTRRVGNTRYPKKPPSSSE